MPKKLSQLDTATSVARNDFLVGYTSPTVNGERRWTIEQLRNYLEIPTYSGQPIQVVQTQVTSTATRKGSDTLAWQAIPEFRATMKLRTDNPNVRVQANIACGASHSNHQAMFRIVKVLNLGYTGNYSDADKTIVGVGNLETGKNLQAAVTASGNARGYGPVNTPHIVTLDFIDENPPGITFKNDSAPTVRNKFITYIIEWYVFGASNSIALNRALINGDANKPSDARAISTLTLTELSR